MGNRIQTGNLGKSKNWTTYGTIQYRTFSQDCLVHSNLAPDGFLC
ncbi:hypothetical protein LEP1GSC158_1898 [Leptospira interrogans serovar Zanoni str. LT2156]|uniref:Uncharacterized protein n=1 Tax=Leptospira interrogans serovar Zanoni str. LT2156 TaxID=1001601 RepID=M6HBW9_LEPIR|nr:hypothetical protein LEP1GSC158_1898 [Leptospira interrogans serovar Zanoni str. LT2156]